MVLGQQFNQQPEVRTLDFLGDQLIRVRHSTHVFPRLGISITTPAGWTYLSVRDDASADSLTFVNEAEQSIVQISRFRFVSWPPLERPIENRVFSGIESEWISADHRQVGRLTQGPVDLCLIVISHRRNSAFTAPVEELIEAIRLNE
jgi:hypothetical protein